MYPQQFILTSSLFFGGKFTFLPGEFIGPLPGDFIVSLTDQDDEMKNFQYLSNVATLKIEPGKCIGCGKCIEVCPHRVFTLEDHKAHIYQFRCLHGMWRLCNELPDQCTIRRFRCRLCRRAPYGIAA